MAKFGQFFVFVFVIFFFFGFLTLLLLAIVVNAKKAGENQILIKCMALKDKTNSDRDAASQSLFKMRSRLLKIFLTSSPPPNWELEKNFTLPQNEDGEDVMQQFHILHHRDVAPKNIIEVRSLPFSSSSFFLFQTNVLALSFKARRISLTVASVESRMKS